MLQSSVPEWSDTCTGLVAVPDSEPRHGGAHEGNVRTAGIFGCLIYFRMFVGMGYE